MHVVQNSNALVKSKLNATIGFYGRKLLPSAHILPWLDAFWSFRGVGVCIIPERCMINKNRIQITSQPPWERLSFDLLWISFVLCTRARLARTTKVTHLWPTFFFQDKAQLPLSLSLSTVNQPKSPSQPCQSVTGKPHHYHNPKSTKKFQQHITPLQQLLHKLINIVVMESDNSCYFLKIYFIKNILK